MRKIYKEEDFICEPDYFHRNWQSCNWITKDGREAFHHRTYTSWMKDWRDVFWLDGWQETEELLMEAIAAHGLNTADYYAVEEFYGPGYFPACSTSEAAINYFNATYI